MRNGSTQMANFRRSKKIGPFRITASKSGLGVSAGAGPFRVSRSAKGRYSRTMRIPGTGIYDTKSIESGAGRSPSTARAQQFSHSPVVPQTGTPKNRAPGGLAALAVGGVLLFALAQCGSEDEIAVSPSTSTSSSTTSSTTTSSRPSTSTTTGSSVPFTSTESPAAPSEAPLEPIVVPPPVNVPDDADNRVAVVPAPQPDPQPIPDPEPVEEPVAEPEPVATSYGSCADVRAAGAAPIYAGDPGYSSKLDRDGDGVACES